MPSADRPENTSDQPPSPLLQANINRLFHMIDDVLVANGTLRKSLKVCVPFTSSLADGIAFYGADSPLFALWNECRAVDALRLVVTGRRG
jgi:hypothetical protein